MTLRLLYKNVPSGTIGTLASAITSSATSFTLSTGATSLLPTITDAGNEGIRLTLGDPAGLYETVEVTEYSADTCTIVVRAVESSLNGGAARAWAAGTPVGHLVTAGSVGNAVQKTDTPTLTEVNSGTGALPKAWSITRVWDAVKGCIKNDMTVGFGTDYAYIALGSIFGNFTIQCKIGAYATAANQSFSVALPITFPTECKMVFVSTSNDAATASGNVSWFQTRTWSTSAVSVICMTVAGSTFTTGVLKPIIIAIGR
jgi:hypothetical protein